MKKLDLLAIGDSNWDYYIYNLDKKPYIVSIPKFTKKASGCRESMFGGVEYTLSRLVNATVREGEEIIINSKYKDLLDKIIEKKATEKEKTAYNNLSFFHFEEFSPKEYYKGKDYEEYFVRGYNM